DNPVLQATHGRVDRSFDLVNARLGEADYLAGGEFTAADIMIGFSLTTMRYFMPYDIARCPNIVRYLARIGERPAYRRGRGCRARRRVRGSEATSHPQGTPCRAGPSGRRPFHPMLAGGASS